MTVPFPLRGATLVVGPSNVGKSRLTARALDAWTAERGTEGVVVLDFAPEVERDGDLLGGRLTRFTDVPAGVWYGAIDAHAPRAESEAAAAAVALAETNAANGATLVDGAPDDPTAVFVNDATIPFQHRRGDVDALVAYCDAAEVAVCNAFRGDELGDVEHPVTRAERAALRALTEWADRRIVPGGTN